MYSHGDDEFKSPKIDKSLRGSTAIEKTIKKPREGGQAGQCHKRICSNRVPIMQRKGEDEEVCQDQLKPLRNSHVLIPVQSPLNKSSFMMGANHTEVSGEPVEEVQVEEISDSEVAQIREGPTEEPQRNSPFYI